MLKYTFSRREKALLLVLAIVVVLIVWFVFVYQGTTNQVAKIESSIADTQSKIQIDQTRASQIDTMKQVVEQRKAEGALPTVMPEYDNMQALMVELNRIMGAADKYTLTFDDLNFDDSDHVARGVRIDYSCGTYRQAESLVNSLAGGAYPCRVDSVAIKDSSAGKSNSSTSSTEKSPVSSSVHVTFFEKYPEGMAPQATGSSSSAAV